MNYEEYYTYCRNIAKVSDNKNLPDLQINNPLIVNSVENYQEKISRISTNIFEDTHGWNHSDPLFINYDTINQLPEVISLGNEFCKILSKEFFGCQMVFDRIECYKNKVTNSSEHSSWKWHYDNCAPYRYKIMVYLSDVNIDNGGMKVLLNKDKSCVSYKSSRIKMGQQKSPMYEGSRIPDSVIDQHIKNGFNEEEITGPIGTTVFFHQNIAHKATIPTKEPSRTCLIYNFRPYHKILSDNFFVNRSDNLHFGGIKDYSTSIG